LRAAVALKIAELGRAVAAGGAEWAQVKKRGREEGGGGREGRGKALVFCQLLVDGEQSANNVL
jgi:hypothetical protein